LTLAFEVSQRSRATMALKVSGEGLKKDRSPRNLARSNFDHFADRSLTINRTSERRTGVLQHVQSRREAVMSLPSPDPAANRLLGRY